MRLPPLPDGAPRLVLILGIPLVAFVITLGLTIGMGSDDTDAETSARATAVPTATAALAVATRPPQPTSSPAPTAVPEPTATAVIVRTDCAAIRGSDYRSDEERAWFQQNCIPAAPPAISVAAAQPAPVAPASSPALVSGSNDRLILARLGINAPVNYRLVTNGEMGNPLGAFDVIWYDFELYGGVLGGYPGDGSNAVIAGHVDYRGVGPAVFYQLRNVQEGDVIDYRRFDGTVVRYVVQWYGDVDPNFDFTQYVAATSGDELTLITCNGEFDFVNRAYSHRRIVRALRTS